jgi:hypothetical protein
MSVELSALTAEGLLKLYSGVLRELNNRKIMRGMNSPAQDVAELLVQKAVAGFLQPKNNKSFDVKGTDGLRYEVKARRLIPENQSRELGAIRDLNDKNFDFLIGVLFHEDFSVFKAAQIPWEIVRENAMHRQRTNSWKFFLEDQVWAIPGVKPMTLISIAQLQADAATTS